MKYLLPVVLIVIAVLVCIFLVRDAQAPSDNTSTIPLSITSPSNSADKTSVKISQGAVPKIPFDLPAGFTIHEFASNLGNPRVLVFSPGGTLLVSDPNGNQVYALPDKNQDGVADSVKTIIGGENHVHGLAFYGRKLYIADVDKVVRYNWNEATLTATKDKVLFSLPENNDHNNRTLAFDSSGKLYISLGSTCNVCTESPQEGGSVLVSNANGTPPQVFATGLRNAAFIHFNPQTNELWGTEMGRDYLGDNLPPDEINIIKQNNNYGWPNCYGNKIPDTNFNPQATAATCASTTAPIFQIPAHNAPLGFTFINSSQFPSDWQGDLLVALHGSWNSSSPVGYKVVHLKVSGNTITQSEDFLTGFLQNGTALARPVDLVFDKKGDLFLSDDKSGNVYIIQKKD